MSSEVFLIRHAHGFLSDCSMLLWLREHQPPGDTSDVSCARRVRIAWAYRVAEVCTWSKWANPIHVSTSPPTEVLTSNAIRMWGLYNERRYCWWSLSHLLHVCPRLIPPPSFRSLLFGLGFSWPGSRDRGVTTLHIVKPPRQRTCHLGLEINLSVFQSVKKLLIAMEYVVK